MSRPRVVNKVTTNREEGIRALGKFPVEECQRKVRFPTRNDARAAAKHEAARHRRDMAVYKCPTCHAYHITKAVEGA